MLTVIIRDSGESNVIKLTYQNLWKELKDIQGAELLVDENWFRVLSKTKNIYICFVEPDCLVEEGYFKKQLDLLQNNSMFRKLAMLSSAVAVNYWDNKFYGYALGSYYTDGVMPIRDKKSKEVYPVQIGYVPGSLIRTKTLKLLFNDMHPRESWQDDLVYLSTQISLGFWSQGDGNRVHLNPGTTYVTTEEYVNDIGRFEAGGDMLLSMFAKESI